MIRGIEGVAKPHELEVGRFYIDPGYGRGTTLFQWVRTDQSFEGSPKDLALVFASEDESSPLLQELPLQGPLLALPPVSIRIDPPSATGTAFTKQFGAGMFVVEPNRAIVGARTGFRSWTPIDLISGRVCRPSNDWIAIARWSLVVDEAGEEIPIATFGEQTAE